MSSRVKSDLSTTIMDGFRVKGMLPGAYRYVWRTYERRLKAHARRAAQLAGVNNDV
jgi:hypothetical protein